MRPTHFLRRVLDTDDVQRIPFDATHYSATGVGYSPAIGMPELEAHQLINKWNVSQAKQRFVYAIE
jgi:hypothetical protein